MLARTPITDTYLTAEELGITDKERDLLIGVRNDLASGLLVHQPDVVSFSTTEIGSALADAETILFNMAQWAGRAECGTAHCIGGFIQARGSYDLYWRESFAFRALFYPNLSSDLWADLTTAQAVRAIDFWATGHQADCWALALSDEA